jgi:hypothetical protein
VHHPHASIPSASVRPGVSVVMPICGGEPFLADTIPAILAQDDGRSPFEIILVDDESVGGGDHLQRWTEDPRIRLVEGPRHGAAAAINVGLRAAAHPLIAQVDQDVRLHPGWLSHLVAVLEDGTIAAAQGWYESPPDASFWGRAAGFDLEDRYRRIPGPDVDHVCTGNSVYRASSLQAAGLFDENLGYGYDNDMSYRLIDAGHRLVFVPRARSTHAWRATLGGYFRQQYGQGYGRLDLVAKHPGRVTGDAVSGLGMMLHAPAMLVALTSVVIAVVAAIFQLGWWPVPAVAGATLLVALTLERLAAATRMVRSSGDQRAFAVVPAHLLRNVAWSAAMVIWAARRVVHRRPRPRHSMAPRSENRT